jgi:hypothetical protein
MGVTVAMILGRRRVLVHDNSPWLAALWHPYTKALGDRLCPCKSQNIYTCSNTLDAFYSSVLRK